MLANSRRWTAPGAEELLPGLFAVDAPRPDEVRFIFRGPATGVRALLGSPRLGIVSPQALAPATGEHSTFNPEVSGSGTGPFELAGVPQDHLELARNADWWGSPLGLGPALDGITFIPAPSEAARLELLQEAEAEVAEPLGPATLRSIASDPLLRTTGGAPGAGGVGYEASVRGIESGAVPVLSGVWLTMIDR